MNKLVKVPICSQIKDGRHRIDLLKLKNDEESEDLYKKAIEMAKNSKNGNPEVKLPTKSEEYYDLEENLMNPARMESGELSVNVYDSVSF